MMRGGGYTLSQTNTGVSPPRALESYAGPGALTEIHVASLINRGFPKLAVSFWGCLGLY